MSLEISPDPRLRIDIFGNIFSSPLILGSGTLVERFEQINPFIEAGAGAIVPRTTRKVMERTLHPSPHLYQTGPIRNETMINAEWTGAAIDYWRPYLDRMSASRQVIMSISGRDADGCADVCQELDSYDFPLLEVNISCAHSNSVHGMITRNGDHIERVVKGIKDAGVETPIAIKLGHSDAIVELSGIAKDAGANAIVATNTYGPVFDFDISKGNPKAIVGIQGGRGGMSGASLFHIALTDVAMISKVIQIPVIACGGVFKADQAIKMVMAGALAVEIYSAAHVRGSKASTVFNDINLGVSRYLTEHNLDSIKDLKGLALPLLDQQTNLLKLIPEVIADNCTGCDRCLPVCLPEAFRTIPSTNNKAGHIVEINHDICVGCGHCLRICPGDALVIESNLWK